MIKKATLPLRSWVQIPPGPFLSASELRYQIELIFGDCLTILPAMPLASPIGRPF
jgi:hypothetical protein